MATSKSGLPIWADTAGLDALARNIRAIAPAVMVEGRAAVRGVGNLIAADARQRASYSTRIPQSITVRTRGFNVYVRAGGDQAPNAAALEDEGRGNPRHPLFGDREHWYTNTTTPAFLGPALDAHRDEAVEMIGAAVQHAIDRTLH